jgi:group II intron reverse transcriptase/maturase
MERRGARDVAQPEEATLVHAEGPYKGYAKLDWIHSAAVARPKERFTSLVHHFNEMNLRQAFHELDGSKAPGIDRVTKDQYAKNLDGNIEALAKALREGNWRPRPSRQVLIPKPQGGMRPLAVGNLEDKIVQTLAARILEAVFDPIFSRHSYGFRRGKSAHQAVGRLYETIHDRAQRCTVVEMDIEKFFDSVDHEQLIVYIETRIADPNFIRLLRRMLKADVLKASGELEPTELGTPQGSPVSPILANIYLHFLLDDWFQKSWSASGRMIRYADDAVFVFSDEDSAQKFRAALAERMAEGKLRLNLDKSAIVPFSRRKPQGNVSFLGFGLYWGRNNAKQRLLKLKTLPKRLSRSISAFTAWIKATRNRMKLASLWRIACARMRGHFNYFGVRTNSAKLGHFYVECVGALFKWLNRRSQRRSFTWETMERRLVFQPLPLPPLEENLRDVTSERKASKHIPKSRMRENRKSGSVRSRGWQHPRFT